MNQTMSQKEDQYYADLYRKCMRASKYNIPTVLEYLQNNYTGDTKKAHTHQMFDSWSWHLTQETKLYNVFRYLVTRSQQEAHHTDS